MNLDNFKKITNNEEFEQKKEDLTKELIANAKDMFMQTFDKDQLDVLFGKFEELNELAKPLGVEFLNKDENKGEFIHALIKEFIKDDKYGANVL